MGGVGCGGSKGGDGNEGPERLAAPAGRGEGVRGAGDRRHLPPPPLWTPDNNYSEPPALGGPEGDASSSLDYIRDTEGDPRRALAIVESLNPISEGDLERCERVKFDLLNLDTGLRVSGRCDVYRCGYCGPRKTLRYQQAAAWVNPARRVGLSLVPERFSQARKQLNDLAIRLRRKGYEWEWFWAIERNPEDTGYHLGAVQKGSYVPQRQLQDMWGGRIPYIDAVKGSRGGGGATAYVTKGATHYVTKGGLGGPEGYYEHLRLNGGRGAHWSRGYFEQPVTDVVHAMRAEQFGEPEGQWVKIVRDL